MKVRIIKTVKCVVGGFDGVDESLITLHKGDVHEARPVELDFVELLDTPNAYVAPEDYEYIN